MIRTRQRQLVTITAWHGRYRGGRWLNPQSLVTVTLAQAPHTSFYAWVPSLRADGGQGEIDDAKAVAKVDILTGAALTEAIAQAE